MDNKIKEKRKFYNIQDSSNMALIGILTPIVMSFVVSILFIIIGSVIGQDAEVLLKTAPWVYFANFVVEFGFVLAYMLYNKNTGIDGISAIRLKQKSNVWIYIIAVFLGLIMPLCCSGIIELWSVGLEQVGYKLSELSVPILSVGDLALAIVFVAIVPAICEELLFRGVVLNGLRNKGKWVAILISALIFALMHNNVEQLPYTFALGLVLGYVAYESGTVLPGMLLHTMNNSIVLVSMYLQQNAIADISLGFTNIMVLDALIWIVIGVVVVVGVFYIIKKLCKENNSVVEDTGYYDNKFILRDGQQVPMTKHIDSQAIKMFKYTIVIGVCLLALSFFTHIGS